MLLRLMGRDEVLPADAIAGVSGIGAADIVVGIPSYNNSRYQSATSCAPRRQGSRSTSRASAASC